MDEQNVTGPMGRNASNFTRPSYFLPVWEGNGTARLELRSSGNVLFDRNEKPNYYENITGRNTAMGMIMGNFEPCATRNYYVLELLMSEKCMASPFLQTDPKITCSDQRFSPDPLQLITILGLSFLFAKNSAAFAIRIFVIKSSQLYAHTYMGDIKTPMIICETCQSGNQPSSIGKLIVLMLNAMHMHCTVQDDLKIKKQ